MKLKPLSNNVLIKPVEKESMTTSGIVLPDSAKEKPTQGEVVAVGPGKKNEDGKIVPVEVSVGDKVLFREYGLSEVEIEEKKYLIGSEDAILGVLAK